MRKLPTAVLILLTLPLLGSRCEYRSEPYFAELDERIAAGQVPDVGYVESMHVRSLSTDGRLAAVDELVDANEFAPAALDAFTDPNGTLRGIPRDMQTVALLYNIDVLDRFGVSPPTTWDELSSSSLAIAERSGGDVTGLALTAETWNWLPFLYQAGGALVRDGEAALLGPGGVEALSFYVDLVRSGAALVPEAGLEPTDDAFPYGAHRQSLELFAGEQVAMVLAPNDALEQALAEQPGRVGAAPLPAGPSGPATIAYVTGVAIYGDPTDAIRELVVRATSEDTQREWSRSLQFMPTRSALIDDYVALHPDAAAFAAGIDTAVDWIPPGASFTALATFDRMARDQIAGAVRGDLAPGEAIAALDALVAELLVG